MKSKKDRDKALAMYLKNISMLKIAEEMDVNVNTITAWRNKYGWVKIKKQSQIKGQEKVADKAADVTAEMIEDQIKIGQKVHKELLIRLNEQEKLRQLKKELEDYWVKATEDKDPTKEELLEFLRELNILHQKQMFDNNLISIMKHALEVVRPKQASSLNIIDPKNVNIELDKLLQATKDGVPYR